MTKEFHASEHVTQKAPFSIDEIGEQSVEAVENIALNEVKERVALEAFMNEMVTVIVHDTTDPNAPRLVYAGVNGRGQWFVRGKPQTVKRMYIERLARSKQTSFNQDLSHQDERMNAVTPHTGLCYPFSVMEDRNPNGTAWLQMVLAQPA